MEYVPVATLDELPPGGRKTVVAGEREIALFNIAGTIYAIDATCPHQGGPLGEGWLEGTLLTCPLHAWCFDLRSGENVLGDYSTIETFDVHVDGNAISISSEPSRVAAELG